MITVTKGIEGIVLAVKAIPQSLPDRGPQVKDTFGTPEGADFRGFSAISPSFQPAIEQTFVVPRNCMHVWSLP